MNVYEHITKPKTFKCPMCRKGRMKKIEHPVLGKWLRSVVYWVCPKCNFEITEHLIMVMLERANKKLEAGAVK